MSAEELPALLRSWGLGDDAIIRSFSDNDVSVDRLLGLTDDEIKELIPKVGPRSTFKSKLKEFGPALQARTPSTSATSTSNDEQIEPDLDDVDVDDGEPTAKKARQDTPSLSPDEFRESLLKAPEVNNLHTVLKSQLRGLMVLGHHKTHEVLDSDCRDHLCELVINNELASDHSKLIEDEGFLKLAKKIKKLFPTEEIETWHASSRDSKGNLVVTGRLRTKYYAVRRGLIRANLIESRRSAKKSNNSVIPDDSFNADDDPEISWLMTNDSPWTEVLTKWDASVAVRRQIVLHLKYYSEYIEKFPALRTQLGWELIAQDGVAIEAKLAQPDWRKWVDVMIKLIRREKGKSEFLKEPNLSDGHKFAAVWLALPSLWNVKTIPKSPAAGKKDTCWRPSMSEIQHGVCIHATTVPEIIEKVSAKKLTLTTYHFGLLPLPVLLGPVENIRQCFIVLDEQRWEVDSVFEAVFGVFRMSFGLHSNYPPEARHAWLFVQQTLFNIQTANDYQKYPRLKATIAARLKEFSLLSS